MQGPYNQSYQPLGDLYLEFPGDDQAATYYRDLDLDRAVATVRFEKEGVVFTREVFASFPDQVIVVRVSSSRPGRLSFTARLDSPLRHTPGAGAADTLALQGRCPAHVDPNYLR